jgi:hypothetical protein
MTALGPNLSAAIALLRDGKVPARMMEGVCATVGYHQSEI